MKRYMLLSLLFILPNIAMAADAAKGKELFTQRCATCHGDKGAGDGPAAAAFPADSRPRNLATGQMKFATDEAKFKELMQKGGGGVGLSMLMPPQPDLAGADLDSLYAFVKSLHQ